MSMFEFNEVYRPFRYPWAVELAALHEKIHWIEDEAEVSRDVEVWASNLQPFERNMITHILRLFTQSDVAVGASYINNLLPYIKNNEIRCMLASFVAREGTHQRAYALVNDTLNLPETEWKAFLEFEQMKEKWEFMLNSYTPKAVRPELQVQTEVAWHLAKQTLMEGVMLFAAFIILLQFKLEGKMLGMGEVVEWSIRDESMHAEGLSKTFLTVLDEFPEINTDEFRASIYQMARDIVSIEEAYIRLVFEMGSLPHLSCEQAIQYTKFMTDYRLLQLGFKANYEVDNPCEWADYIISGRSLKNFFETRVTAYQKGGLTGTYAEGYDHYFGK